MGILQEKGAITSNTSDLRLTFGVSRHPQHGEAAERPLFGGLFDVSLPRSDHDAREEMRRGNADSGRS